MGVSCMSRPEPPVPSSLARQVLDTRCAARRSLLGVQSAATSPAAAPQRRSFFARPSKSLRRSRVSLDDPFLTKGVSGPEIATKNNISGIRS